MSEPHSPRDAINEEREPETIVYDPTDPFWNDEEADDDDMEYHPDEDDDEDINFHGKSYRHLCLSAHD